MSRDFAEVRTGEELPRAPLAAWLGERLAGGDQVEVLQFPAGTFQPDLPAPHPDAGRRVRAAPGATRPGAGAGA